MLWVAPLSVVMLVVGAALTVGFLSRNQWTLNAEGYEVRVRSSLVRAALFIDGDPVSEAWRRPGRLVELRGLVESTRGELTTFTAVIRPRLGRPVCQVFVDGDWMTARPGSCLHIPPGVPHACVVTEATDSARMLMIFQPAGFDLYLAELGELSVQELNDPLKMEELARKYDIINLGDVPERSRITVK